MWILAGTQDFLGTIDGVNKTFLASVSLRPDAQVYVNGLARLPGGATENGYTLVGRSVVLDEAPVPGDTVALWQVSAASSGGTTTPVNGPTPVGGGTLASSPTLATSASTPQGSTWAPPTGSASILTPQGGTTWPTSP